VHIALKMSSRTSSIICALDDFDCFLLVGGLHRDQLSSEIAPKIEADRSEKTSLLTKHGQAYDEKASSKQPHLHVRPVVPNAIVLLLRRSYTC